ncbi:MAG: hypothetical protein AAFU80_24385 [Pseudomonadota bacterium]
MVDTVQTAPPPRFERPSALAFLGYAAGVMILIWSFEGAGWSAERIMRAPEAIADFLSRAWPPGTGSLERLTWKMLETLQIALSGAALGVVLSVPIALLAARNLIAGPIVNHVVRMILGFIRAVPDIAWALVFVVAVGLGPFAGVLAIMMDTIGFCGRFFADDM